jgi:outer membrane lipoprotein SlyB
MTRLSLRPAAAVVAILALGAGLAACETPGPYNYAPYEAGRAVPLEPATVVNFRPVQIGGQSTGAGVATGAVVGAASGAAIGGDAAGTIVGGLVGAVLGNAVERGATRHTGFAYDVRMNRSGRILEVVQPDAYPIPVNAPVYVSFGPITRIIPASAYGPPPGAPPPPPRPY